MAPSPRSHGEQADIEMIFGSACDWQPRPRYCLRILVSRLTGCGGGWSCKLGQDCEEAWWHRIAWLPPYDGSGNRRDRASRAGRTLRRGGLNQTERQNKAKYETQPHALLRRFETLLETVSPTCGSAYAKSAESHLSRAVFAAWRNPACAQAVEPLLIQAERHPSEIRGIRADPHQNGCQQTDHTRLG
jgi:hypothetical protein